MKTIHLNIKRWRLVWELLAAGLNEIYFLSRSGKGFYLRNLSFVSIHRLPFCPPPSVTFFVPTWYLSSRLSDQHWPLLMMPTCFLFPNWGRRIEVGLIIMGLFQVPHRIHISAKIFPQLRRVASLYQKNFSDRSQAMEE